MAVVEKRERGEGIEQLGETEGARRATGGSSSAGLAAGVAAGPGGAETEVVARAQRRRFTAEYKRRIVREADRCTHAGEIGALLRREGLYSSHVTSWREVTLYRQQSIAFRPWDAAARGAGQRPTSNVT